RAIPQANVNVMRRPDPPCTVARYVVTLARERFPARDPQIAFVEIARAAEAPHDLDEMFVGLDDHVEVDDGFGGEARNGRAADVLYGECQPAERPLENAPERIKCNGPCRIVLHDDDRLWIVHARGGTPLNLGQLRRDFAGLLEQGEEIDHVPA